MRRSSAFVLTLLGSILVSFWFPAIVAGGPLNAAPESLAGSKVVFAPGAGAACYTPGIQSTFAFAAHSQTGDWEYAYHVWLKFPSTWTIDSVALSGSPSCNGGSLAALSWSFETSSYEVNIYHPRYHAPTDSCDVAYAIVATPSGSTGDVNVPWYWDGDGYASVPHHPCSVGAYTPSSMSAEPCDSAVDLAAVVPMCTDVVSADLAVTIDDGASTYVPGADAVYTVTVSNDGPEDVTGAAVSAALPSYVVDAVWTCAASAGSNCTAAGIGGISDTVDLLNGGTATYTWTLEVLGNRVGDLEATATVAAPAGVSDPDTSDNSASDTDTLAPLADLSITKVGTFTLVPGGEATYLITVHNDGPADATDVVVADPTPAGMTFVSNSGDCTTAFPCNLGTITAGGARTITAVFQVDPDTPLTRFVNEASVESPADYELASNAASAQSVLATDIPLLDRRALLALVLFLAALAATRLR